MAVPAEPNAEAWANLIQDQGQGQPLVQDQQIQAQPPQAPPGAVAAQIQVGEFTCLSKCFAKWCHLCVTLSLLSPARIFCYRVFT